MEEAVATVLRLPEVAVTGAGRTDAGVNASMMIAHIDLPDPVTDDARLVRALNSITGPDIAIRWIKPVHADAHARFDASIPVGAHAAESVSVRRLQALLRSK